MESLEVEQMLGDERYRSEQHRQNYLLLKEENARLRSECLSLQQEMRDVLQECKRSKDVSRSALEKASSALRQKESQLLGAKADEESGNEARIQMLTKEIREKLEQAEDEKDLLRDQCNHLAHQNLRLETQLEALHASQSALLQEKQLKHHTELRLLQDSVESLRSKGSRGAEERERECQVAQKECGLLRAVASQLSSELEEVSARRELLSQQYREAKREADKHLGTVRGLELERISLVAHREELQKELRDSKAREGATRGDVQGLLHEQLALKGALDDQRHSSEVERTQLKMEVGNLRSRHRELQSVLEEVRAEKKSLEAQRNKEQALEIQVQRLQETVALKIQNEDVLQDRLRQVQDQRDSLKGNLDCRTRKLEKIEQLKDDKSTELFQRDIDQLRCQEKELTALEAEREGLEMRSRLVQQERELADQAQQHQKKVSKYRTLIGKLRGKMELMEEGRIRKEDLLQRSVPWETHEAVKKQLRDLQRRHAGFRTILVSGQQQQLLFGEEEDSASQV